MRKLVFSIAVVAMMVTANGASAQSQQSFIAPSAWNSSESLAVSDSSVKSSVRKIQNSMKEKGEVVIDDLLFLRKKSSMLLTFNGRPKISFGEYISPDKSGDHPNAPGIFIYSTKSKSITYRMLIEDAGHDYLYISLVSADVSSAKGDRVKIEKGSTMYIDNVESSKLLSI